MNLDQLSITLLSRVEDAGINASAPPQQRWVDGWLLRFSPGKAKRARCVQAVADGRLPLAERLAASPVPCQGWVLRRSGDIAVMACGQTATEGTLFGLYDVFTHPAVRGQGLARRLCAALLGRARAAGAQLAYLQVEVDNLPARTIYRRLGFVDAYRYHYRTPDRDAH